MKTLDDFLQGVRTAAIAGHVNPDGDCIGSVLGIWLYLRDNYPHIQAEAYLEPCRDVIAFLEGLDQAKRVCGPETSVDLMILTDISSRDRIGVAGQLAEQTEKTLCFDHHVTNTGSYTWFFNRPEASSACEVVYGFLDPDKISKACAEALYTGIAHDTGVFQYSCTSPQTMRIAADLMNKGIDFPKILDESVYQKTDAQHRIMGKVLEESRVLYDGKLILGTAGRQDMLRYGVESKDMEGIVSELRNTVGAEAAAFLYEQESGVWKVSLRSRLRADVSLIAREFGGGGHVRAAGCTMTGTRENVEDTVIRAFAGIL